MFQINLETHLKLYFSNIFLVIIKTSILMSKNTKKLPLRKGFQNPHLAFYLKQIDKPNWKSKLNLELFGSIFLPELEMELFSSNFFSELETELLGTIFFCSQLELEPQSSGDQIGVGSKLEPIVHLCVKVSQRILKDPKFLEGGGGQTYGLRKVGGKTRRFISSMSDVVKVMGKFYVLDKTIPQKTELNCGPSGFGLGTSQGTTFTMIPLGCFK